MAYPYAPPPAPPSAAPSNLATSYPPAQYGQAQAYGQSSRGGHGARGRGGGNDRNGYQHQHQQSQPGPQAYNYPQQPPYGQHTPAPYPGPHPPQPAAYAQQQPQQQQWHPEQHPQQSASHAPLAAGNYHPNYAPQHYQQPAQPYAGQPPYPPAPQPPYLQGYPATVPPQPAPPAQPWGSHPQPQGQSSYGSGGRGGRGGYNDRGGPKGQMMGPPIRIGFDGHAPAPQAPVSTSYPPQPYAGHQGPPSAYALPAYNPYPAPAPYMPAAPPQYDGPSGHNPRHSYRNGVNPKPRGQFGGDKMARHRNPRGVVHTPPTHHQKPDAASAGKKKKRKTNTLGLTPGDDSEEDDENEEQKLEELIGAEAPNPIGPEIEEWIAVRRANFPTKAKIEAKKAAAKYQAPDRASSIEKEEQEMERLKRQLRRVESSIKRKREQQDEGDEMRDVDVSSPSSDGIKSEDEKPEVMSTRHEPSTVPPPTKKADPTKHCKYYSTGGTCGKRGKCRFVHDPAVREAALREREEIGGRLTLEHRLTLNDKEQEDMTIVRSLKYLHEKGEIQRWVSSKDKNAPASNAKQEQPSTTAQSQPRSQASLPPTPARLEPGSGLPAIPPTVAPQAQAKYSGWNLSGFGNTGVRSSDM